MSEHRRYSCKDFGCLLGSTGLCLLCDGGLFMCGICGQAEADLEPVCPGPCYVCRRPYEDHEYATPDQGCEKYALQGEAF